RITYFDMPVRGEVVRLALVFAGVKFEDERIEYGDWAGLKPQTPWFTLPVLTLPDG
ncbi:glutathione S-transferase family member gst-9, partial [Pavlovales sp. CCMP2436]